VRDPASATAEHRLGGFYTSLRLIKNLQRPRISVRSGIVIIHQRPSRGPATVRMTITLREQCDSVSSADVKLTRSSAPFRRFGSARSLMK
jgi:hypothetical protein